jgi:type IV pilus assembly protein PilW
MTRQGNRQNHSRMTWRGQQGVTLVELMIGLSISLVLIAAAGTALIGSDKATNINDLTAQTQQNVRVAMELITHDLKMAGYGGMVTGAIGACNNGIVPVDNNPVGADAGADGVNIVVPLTSSTGALWTLTAPASGPFTQLSLSSSDLSDMVAAGLVAGSSISIGGAMSQAVIGPVNPAAGSLALGTPTGTPVQVPAPTVFPTGTPVFLLQCITYQVNTNAATCGGNAPCLLRGVAPNLLPIAEGIVDLQLAYACDGCVSTVNGGVADRIIDDQDGGGIGGFTAGDFVSNANWAFPPMSPDSIRMVRVTIVAQQTRTDLGFGEGKSQGVNNSVAMNVDGDNNLAASPLRRRVLTRTVETRNIGL